MTGRGSAIAFVVATTFGSIAEACERGSCRRTCGAGLAGGGAPASPCGSERVAPENLKGARSRSMVREVMGTHADAWIGTAGWTIPKASTSDFAGDGTHLQRYARVLTGAEINSSFYRPHKPSTYEKWAAAVPAGFRFAVKVPKEITHVQRLGGGGEVAEILERFLGEAGALGPSLGPLLVQLPPSLAFVPAVAKRFFTTLRRRFAGPVVCEPRHATWFLPEPQALLTSFHVAQVAADPALSPAAARPGGWRGLVYYRLHGSPTIYRSQYSPQYLDVLARTLTGHLAAGTPVWCIFDNTAEGAAIADALGLLTRLGTAPVTYRGDTAAHLS